MSLGEWHEYEDDLIKTGGWYAVTRCWDPREGLFPSAMYIEAGCKPRAVIAYYGPFPDSETAEAWAYAHDMEG